MPLIIVRNDITKMHCDAIVCPTDEYLSGAGGTDAAVHKAAGAGLDAVCPAYRPLKKGTAVVTPAFMLHAKYIIHTAGPEWRSGNSGEEIILESCYRSCLQLAKQKDCKSIAFPLIAAGTFSYPKAKAIKLAERVIRRFLQSNDMTVYIVIYGRREYIISRSLFDDIKSFIDDNYINTQRVVLSSIEFCAATPMRRRGEPPLPSANAKPIMMEDALDAGFSEAQSLEEVLKSMDESFTHMLLRKIDESGMTDAQCYNKANIDRKLFSKIKNNPDYRPKKTTALAFAIALELTLDDTKSLLEKAGYALSRSNKFDVIVEYFIRNRKYDIFEINEALYEFDQTLLGA